MSERQNTSLYLCLCDGHGWAHLDPEVSGGGIQEGGRLGKKKTQKEGRSNLPAPNDNDIDDGDDFDDGGDGGEDNYGHIDDDTDDDGDAYNL